MRKLMTLGMAAATLTLAACGGTTTTDEANNLSVDNMAMEPMVVGNDTTAMDSMDANTTADAMTMDSNATAPAVDTNTAATTPAAEPTPAETELNGM